LRPYKILKTVEVSMGGQIRLYNDQNIIRVVVQLINYTLNAIVFTND